MNHLQLVLKNRQFPLDTIPEKVNIAQSLDIVKAQQEAIFFQQKFVKTVTFFMWLSAVIEIYGSLFL